MYLHSGTIHALRKGLFEVETIDADTEALLFLSFDFYMLKHLNRVFKCKQTLNLL